MPLSNNYIDPDNFRWDGELYSWEFSSINPFRIKEDTVYTLHSKRYTEYFFGEVNLAFYDEAGKMEEVIPKIRVKKYREYGTYEISFTTPVLARYMQINFKVDILSQPPRDSDNILDEFILYEGENEVFFSDYEGPDKSNETLNDGQLGYIKTNIDEPILPAIIQNSLKAIDYIAGDLTDNIEIIEDTYSDNLDELGTYYLTFGVSDDAGNQSIFRVFIEIIDDSPPIISGNNYLLTSPKELLLENEIKSFLTVFDNYDEIVEILLTYDDYSCNYQELGLYEMVFSARDSSGNESSFLVSIEVADLDEPKIKGPDIIRKSYQETLPISDILLLYTANDEIDGDVSSSIKIIFDNYTEYMYRIGNQSFTIEASDKSGNKIRKEVIVEVYDGVGPVFIIDKGVIDIKLIEEEIDLEGLIYEVQENGRLPNDEVIKIIEDNYTSNKKTPGVYRVVLESKGELFDIVFTVEKELIKTNTIFENIGGFIKRTWQNFSGYFKKLLV